MERLFDAYRPLEPGQHLNDEELQYYAESGLEADSPVAAHLAQCDACMHTYQTYCRMMAELRAHNEYTLPMNFADKVVEKVRKAGERSPLEGWVDENLGWFKGWI
jgi:anti-sigma factor RsiW